MNYKIVRTLTFQNQLDQILDYLNVSFSKEKALDYLLYLENQLDSLKKFPNFGKKVCLKTTFIKPTNAFVSKNNIVFYRVYDQEKTIVLLAIATANQNYLNLMS